MSFLKQLGASFGFGMLASLAAGKDKRTAFREAGVGSLVGVTFKNDPDMSEAVSLVARQLMLSRQINQPVELDAFNEKATPNTQQHEEASREVEAVMNLSTVDLLAADQELHEFEEGIVQARALIFDERRRRGIA